MHNLGDTLRTLKRDLQSSTQETSTRMETGSPPTVEEAVCSMCEGRRFVRKDLNPWDEGFGKAYPCPVCVTGERKDKDWFKGLEEKDPIALSMSRRMAQYPEGWLVLQGPVGTGKTLPRSSSQRMTPVAASSPKALPPVSSTACTRSTSPPGRSRSVSRVPGAPPRTSADATAPSGQRTTVQPVAACWSVQWPTSSASTAVIERFSRRFRRTILTLTAYLR